jgi:hypothetical protein
MLAKTKNICDRITKLRKSNRIEIDNSEKSEIPTNFHKTLNDDHFLKLEFGERHKKTCVFNTHKNLKYLESASIWVMDGTFFSCPVMFEQLYTIQAFVRGKFRPLGYNLMYKKDVETYENVFSYYKTKIIAQPTLIIVDFELAPIAVIKKLFSNSRIYVAFFIFRRVFGVKRKVSAFQKSIWKIKNSICI